MTAIITFLILGILLLEQFSGGVVSHHLFENKDLPKISNWWGILTKPVVSWLTLFFIQKNDTNSNNEQEHMSKSKLYGF